MDAELAPFLLRRAISRPNRLAKTGGRCRQYNTHESSPQAAALLYVVRSFGITPHEACEVVLIRPNTW